MRLCAYLLTLAVVPVTVSLADVRPASPAINHPAPLPAESLAKSKPWHPAVVYIRNLDICTIDLEHETLVANSEFSRWKAQIDKTERLMKRHAASQADLAELQDEKTRAMNMHEELREYAVSCITVATIARAKGVPDNKMEKWPPLVAVNDALNDFNDLVKHCDHVESRARKAIERQPRPLNARKD